jgi:Ca2+-binding RTX toxin-like protein
MRRHKFNSPRNFEVLEDRRMMTGDISYNSTSRTLTINGAGYDDVAVVRFEGNKVYADLLAGEGNGGTDHHDKDKNISDVSKIVFNGFAGNDRLNVVVNQLNSGVTLDNVVLEFHGGDNDDQLINQLQGGVKVLAFGEAGNDILQGSKFNDVLEGGTGNDTLSGGAGNDTYVFSGSADLGVDSIRNEAANAGIDTLDLTNLGFFADVNLTAVFNPAATGPQYTVKSQNLHVTLSDATAIENVIGTAYADTIIGNSRDNVLRGLGEDDELEGAGGNDTLDGGAGNDTYFFRGGNLGTDTIIEVANADRDALDFTYFARGVVVDIAMFGTLFAVNNSDLKLKLSSSTSIENVYGSLYDDTILGNSRDNEIWGYYGNDTLDGRGGADELRGERGDDKITTDALDHAFGGGGRDWFDKNYEPLFPWSTPANPLPGRYMDWGSTDTPEVDGNAGHNPRASARIPTLLR